MHRDSVQCRSYRNIFDHENYISALEQAFMKSCPSNFDKTKSTEFVNIVRFL